MSFLAVITKKVVDVPARDAAIDEDDNVTVPAQAEESHFEVEQEYIENDAGTIARNIANGVDITYYAIDYDENFVPSLSRVREKKTTKQPPVQRIVKIQDESGAERGEAIVDG